ncbi:DNAJ domain-containing protein Scj1 [Schizosaccharomyces japonicus yFS275]|uniref:DNAJ domain-containing protein Scj1 n=1 Tax=Schizosaccharomyces japonicus (strain yFS275 / FY16936) TaxID=402676 RepID=B6JVJ2_SCHJY|nr:DNAJ domain-containing protein Scj1 [Schizosaccharomyces japonicus yFS275]EEB05393.2 DNAJ domain-containing protein Scj1 [Schizosaccharomyces japonicus yFS275]
MLLRFFFFAFLLFQLVLAAEDYYKVLGVNKGASDSDIRKAYKQLSKKWHPDKNKGNKEAEEKFMEIGRAYEVLSDPEKKQIYDTYGEEGVERSEHGQNPGGAPQGNPFGGGFEGGFGDFFGNLFGGRNPFGNQGPRRGPNMDRALQIDLATYYKGAAFDIYLDVNRICDSCKGQGFNTKYSKDKAMQTCTVCGGHGIRVVKRMIAPGMFQQMQMPCDACHGTGVQIKHSCPKCHGNRVVQKRETFTVNIPAGAPVNYRMTFSEKADESPDYKTGDINIILQESPNNNEGWTRKGDDLYRKEELSVKDALLGNWKKTIRHLDGHLVTVTRNAGSVVRPGEVEKVKNEGMPKFDERKNKPTKRYGNAFIEWSIKFPKKISGQFLKDLTAVFKKHEATYDEL